MLWSYSVDAVLIDPSATEAFLGMGNVATFEPPAYKLPPEHLFCSLVSLLCNFSPSVTCRLLTSNAAWARVSQTPRTVAYGSIALPNVCGNAELTCRTWRPLARGLLEEAVECMDGLGFWGVWLTTQILCFYGMGVTFYILRSTMYASFLWPALTHCWTCLKLLLFASMDFVSKNEKCRKWVDDGLICVVVQHPITPPQ